jgi:hypothetical protein
VASPALISSFSNAVAGAEGYGASSTNLPTSTNNPGDIGTTGNGTVAGYATPEAGWAALDSQVSKMFTGTSKIYNPNMTIAQVGNAYSNGDPNWAVNVANKLGVSPDTTLAQLANGSVPYNSLPRPSGSSSSTGGSPAQTSTEASFFGVNDASATAAVPVQGSTISADQAYAAVQAAFPSLVTYAGLDEVPWFADKSILQVDGATKAIPQPVTFQIFFNTNLAPVPIVLELNASLANFERSMRHVINRQPTRTGFLLSFWGMQPDLITGTGSTGLFSNQLGMTDFLSLSSATSDVQQMILQVFRADTRATANIETMLNASNGFLRIAAKDAFVEFLALFKNNGTVYFQNPNYSGYTTQQQQMAPNLWSPITGSTVVQNAARRNDVLTRGAVALNFRNSTYFGYFKSLTWQMDAENPFRWTFNFTFQVERTVTNVPIPDVS